MKWYRPSLSYRNSISCCSRVIRSALSSDRKRCSVCEPERRLRSLVCTMPRQLPGVTCTTFITRQRSFWCWMIMPTRSCVAGINMGWASLPSAAARRNSSRRLGGHHDEHRQAFGAGIPHRVVLAGRRTHQVARADVALLAADADASAAGQDVVELVTDRVPVPRLRLSGFETVHVAEEVRRVHQTDLLHLLGREGDQGRDVTEAFHGRSPYADGRTRASS